MWPLPASGTRVVHTEFQAKHHTQTNQQTLLQHHQTADAMKKAEGQVTE